MILLVDDHPTSLLAMQLQLQALGLQSCGASDGPAALALLAERKVALVLMDCSMPGMSGYTATRRIRERQQRDGGPHLPVIALSMATDQSHLLQCLRSGMDGVLEKPLRPEQLLQLLALWLPDGAGPRQSAALPPLPVDIDLDALYANALRADLDALRQAIARWDLDQALRMSHRLGGAARYAGAEALGAQAAALQIPLKAADRSAAGAASERLQAALDRWLLTR
nr:response regulator [Stenotrophomonas rhizophila]